MFMSVRAALAAALACFCAAPPATAQSALDKGHRILLERGLQIQAVTLPEFNDGWFSRRDVRLAHFTGVTMGLIADYDPRLYGDLGTLDVGVCLLQPGTPMQPALDLGERLVSLQYLDEQYIHDPRVRATTTQWFEAARRNPALDDVILYTDQFGSEIPLQSMRYYLAESKPDMLMLNWYTFGSVDPAHYRNGSPTSLYRYRMMYRNLALAGHDGSGRQPIPYGTYLQTFATYQTLSPISARAGHRMSESDLRLDQFSAWTMGFTFASAFTFDSITDAYPGLGPLLFDGDDRSARRTKEFRYMAETNRQSRNLGPTLVRLGSTDVRMLTGPLSNRNHGVPEWDPAADADPYITGLSAANPGTVLGGERGDVMVGFFEPLPGLESGDAAHDRYFMVLNGLSGENVPAAAATQLIRLDFDFGDSGVNGLQRVSRDTGLMEDVPLAHDGGSRYHLEWSLPGGTADLFRYHRGGVSAVPEPAGAGGVLVAAALTSSTSRTWSRRRRAR
jgi:hypothetical protein